MKKYIKANCIMGLCIVSTESLRPTTLKDEKFKGYLESTVNVGRMYEVLDESDDIKDLIDVYVAIHSDGSHEIEHKYWDIYDYDELYGAIWVDNGLKYVAKYDSYEGEFIPMGKVYLQEVL